MSEVKHNFCEKCGIHISQNEKICKTCVEQLLREQKLSDKSGEAIPDEDILELKKFQRGKMSIKIAGYEFEFQIYKHDALKHPYTIGLESVDSFRDVYNADTAREMLEKTIKGLLKKKRSPK